VKIAGDVGVVIVGIMGCKISRFREFSAEEDTASSVESSKLLYEACRDFH
jgi:hypothetical protein